MHARRTDGTKPARGTLPTPRPHQANGSDANPMAPKCAEPSDGQLHVEPVFRDARNQTPARFVEICLPSGMGQSDASLHTSIWVPRARWGGGAREGEKRLLGAGCDPKAKYALSAVLSTEGRVVGLCWENLKPKGPKEKEEPARGTLPTPRPHPVRPRFAAPRC